MTTEDTLTTDEHEAMIQEMLARAPKTELEGDLTKNPVLQRGDSESAPTMVVHEISSAGYIYLFETDTGDRVPCLYYMAGQKLRSKFKDGPNMGKYRFSTVAPKVRRKRGTFKCLLHTESPDRGHYDDLGFKTCPKSNITNQYQLTQHMRLRHKQEWAAIEEERYQRERQEDRALQRLVLEQAGGKTTVAQEETVGSPEAPLYVSDKPEKPRKKRIVK